MDLVAKLDDHGKPAWIVVMILGFIIFWPIGLAILAYLIWSGRMGCWKHGGPGRWHNADAHRRRRRRRRESTGNSAFDEYREETLRRLEEEREEFEAFLDRLRFAKDKMEFDQFMAERRDRADKAKDDPAEDGPAPQPSA